jgi:hypothetical protein
VYVELFCTLRTDPWLPAFVTDPQTVAVGSDAVFRLGDKQLLMVPLWIPIVLVAFPTAVLWRRDHRRFSPGHCRKCGYNLTGNVTGRCPECGTPTPAPPG